MQAYFKLYTFYKFYYNVKITTDYVEKFLNQTN